jgi:DNA-binding response OmpR family regulator
MKEKKKILIADDDKSIHDLLTEALRTDEYDIIHAYDGKETLQRAKDELPDLVVLDTMLPVTDGRDVCKQLKSDPDTNHMKIVILSERNEQHDRILGFQLGADDYIGKSTSVNYISRRITKLLAKEG